MSLELRGIEDTQRVWYAVTDNYRTLEDVTVAVTNNPDRVEVNFTKKLTCTKHSLIFRYWVEAHEDDDDVYWVSFDTPVEGTLMDQPVCPSRDTPTTLEWALFVNRKSWVGPITLSAGEAAILADLMEQALRKAYYDIRAGYWYEPEPVDESS